MLKEFVIYLFSVLRRRVLLFIVIVFYPILYSKCFGVTITATTVSFELHISCTESWSLYDLIFVSILILLPTYKFVKLIFTQILYVFGLFYFLLHICVCTYLNGLCIGKSDRYFLTILHTKVLFFVVIGLYKNIYHKCLRITCIEIFLSHEWQIHCFVNRLFYYRAILINLKFYSTHRFIKLILLVLISIVGNQFLCIRNIFILLYLCDCTYINHLGFVLYVSIFLVCI